LEGWPPLHGAYTTNPQCGFLGVGLFSGLNILLSFYPRVVGTDQNAKQVRALCQNTRLYLDANTTVRFGAVSAGCEVDVLNQNVTGYLIDVE
jgi:hypothetical protein